MAAVTTLLRKPLLWLIVGVLAAAGTATGILLSHGSKPAAKVLGEKVVGSGSSSTSSNSSSGNGQGNNGNGNGNGGNSPGHAFTISGGVSGLFPGVTSKLFLTVTNPNNQAMTVTGLTATLQSVTGAGCAATSANLTIGSYSGGQFDVAKNSSVTSSGYIPLSLPTSVANACQGATYNLTYSGTAVQK